MPLARLVARSEGEELRRDMGLGALVLMGVGGTVGAGIFVVTGTAAAHYAGPAIALSFLIASVCCLCAGLCYAELASTIPVAGSAYTYSYATLGEFVAWTIGWNLILEYLFATSAVAIGWSGYFLAFLHDLGIEFPTSLSTSFLQTNGPARGYLNAPAAAVVLFVSWILARGMRKSTAFNVTIVSLKMIVISLVLVFGISHVHSANWRPFIPANGRNFGEFGWSGVIRGASVVFFAYIGFDMVSSSAQEVRNPRRNVPLALLLTLAVVTVLYMCMSLVMTGLAPYRELDVPDPVFVALAHAGNTLTWLRPIVSCGVVIGLLAALFLAAYGQTRIFYAMSCDKLIPSAFSALEPKTRTPVFATWFVGIAAATLAALIPLRILSELVSIGTLMAFGIVCVGVLVLRFTRPEVRREFRVPFVIPVAVSGASISLYLMISLPAPAWVRLAVWVVAGTLIYVLYGRKRSLLVSSKEPASSTRGAL